MRVAQIFRYVLDLPSSDYGTRFVDPYADAIAQVPGLIRKTWMADFENDLPSSDYGTRFVDPYADAIAQVPGLIRKTWMADFENGIFASFYLWQDRASMDAFMTSPAIAKVAAEPFLKDLTITALPVMEDASEITRGN